MLRYLMPLAAVLCLLSSVAAAWADNDGCDWDTEADPLILADQLSERIQDVAYLQGRVLEDSTLADGDLVRHRLTCASDLYDYLVAWAANAPDLQEEVREMVEGIFNVAAFQLGLLRDANEKIDQMWRETEARSADCQAVTESTQTGPELLYRTAAEWAVISAGYYGGGKPDQAQTAHACAGDQFRLAVDLPDGSPAGLGKQAFLHHQLTWSVPDSAIALSYPPAGTGGEWEEPSAALTEDPTTELEENGSEEDNVYGNSHQPSGDTGSNGGMAAAAPEQSSDQPSLRDQLNQMKEEGGGSYAAIAIGTRTVDMSQAEIPHPFVITFAFGQRDIATAEQAALSFCHEKDGGNCYIADRWSGSGVCRYIARGFAEPLTPETMMVGNYGVGESEADAVARCQSAFLGMSNDCGGGVQSVCND